MGGAQLEVERALSIARQVAQCLTDAGAVGNVYRDLCPANVMVASGDVVKVMDFGVAWGSRCARGSLKNATCPLSLAANCQLTSNPAEGGSPLVGSEAEYSGQGELNGRVGQVSVEF
jgi:serine/threonine protein kinase